jgi:hypothetical protein
VTSSISSFELLKELSGFGSPLIVMSPQGISLLDITFLFLIKLSHVMPSLNSSFFVIRHVVYHKIEFLEKLDCLVCQTR